MNPPTEPGLTQDPPFVIARTVAAPRELVFKLWTEREHMARWFGPKGVTIFSSSLELAPGKTYHYGMRTENGVEMWGKWTFREIVEPERLVFVSSFSDENGGMGRHPLAPDWPREMLSTITFEAEGDRTKITVSWVPLNATEAERNVFDAGRGGMTQGWTGTFERLDHYIANLQP